MVPSTSRTHVVTVIYSVVLAALVASAGAPTNGSLMHVSALDTLGRFPSVEGTSLEGEHFTLPADFKSELNVVLVAFTREQQNDVDSWTPFLKTLGASHPDLRAYELPTLGRRYRLMRSFIDGGMRRGIPDAAVRATTITLYIDKSPFRESLKLPDEDRIYVLLVDKQGSVYWQAAGRFTESMGSELASLAEQREQLLRRGGR